MRFSLDNIWNMRLLLILSCLLFISCQHKQPKEQQEEQPPEVESAEQINVPEFQAIIDSAAVKGSVLIYDLKRNQYYSNDFEWASVGRLPASTFKIVNSIIAFETGVVDSDSTLFPWNGEKRRMSIWEQDLIFREAFHKSCVPCYQEVARKIGVERMNQYLGKFNYGQMIVDSSSIDRFWLEGESKVSQFQQIDVLKSFYLFELGISKRTRDMMSEMMVIEQNEDYKLSGKTGWSIRNGNNNGWFVGYIEYHSQLLFFASNISPLEQFNMKMFPVIRKDITMKALHHLRTNQPLN